MSEKKSDIKLFDPSKITGFDIACVCAHLGIGSKKVFAEPPPIDIDELLPDEFFNWHAIGIGCDCAKCRKKEKSHDWKK